MNKEVNESFLSKENVEMIWELIADEDIMRNITRQQSEDMQKLFLNDIRQFYQREKLSNKDLMNMNKQFIEIMLPKMSRPIVSQPRESPTKVAITAEDIQLSRMSEFENQLANRQNEFSSAMTMKVPEKPKFDDELDRPISEMEDLIARTLAQRNFDIEQIQQNINKEQVKTFLKSEETSIKSEKLETRKNMQQQISGPIYNIDENEVKYIKISSEDIPHINDVIDIQKSQNIERRQVSWADEENIKLNIISGGDSRQNIFSKLKMKAVAPSLSPFLNVLDEGLKPVNDTNYEEEFKNIHKRISDLSVKIDEMFDFIKNKN
jgi:hypothetical protein